MSQPVDREGQFRADIIAYGLKEMESGAMSVSIRAKLTQFYDGVEWLPWEEYGMEAEGDIWIVKKDNGGLNSNGVQSLVNHAGWDGNMESIVNETWQPSACQVAVKREEYKGNVRFKIAFVNDWNRTPGAMSNIDAAKAKELQARFGAQLRAIAGNVKRNGSPPASKPATPPPARAVAPTSVPPSGGDKSDDIPF